MKAMTSWRTRNSYAQLYLVALLLSVNLCFSSNALAQCSTGFGDGGEVYTLDLREVDVGILIDHIAEISGKNFVVDSRVKATVTVFIPNAVNRKQLYDAFLSVLEVYKFAAVEHDNYVLVVPEDAILIDKKSTYKNPDAQDLPPCPEVY